jgi:hypothetical protein
MEELLLCDVSFLVYLKKLMGFCIFLTPGKCGVFWGEFFIAFLEWRPWGITSGFSCPFLIKLIIFGA